MAQPQVPSLGDQWQSSIIVLSAAYGWPTDKMQTAVYAVAEQVHRHYCLSRGIVNHNEARPDQHVAVSILSSLAGADWWMARLEDLCRKAEESPVESNDT
jgi:hypothetical protein